MAGTDVRLKVDRFRQVTNTAGHTTNVRRAEVLGVDEATMSRLMGGSTLPSNRVIAAILDAYRAWAFEDLFEVVSAAAENDEELVAA